MASEPTELRRSWRLPADDRFPIEDPRFLRAMVAHDRAVDAGEQGYLDPTSGLFVMTATYLASRPCCGNECRHCPWLRS